MSKKDVREFLRGELSALTCCIHGARVQEAARCRGISESELLDFSNNLNPLRIDITPVLEDALSGIDRYPDNDYVEFRRAAAGFVGLKPENIIPGNGSTELIRLFADVVLEQGDRVFILHPSFGEYERECRLQGAEVLHRSLEEMLCMDDSELSQAKAVFLCNPNNPTGTLVSPEDLLPFTRRCADVGVFLFVDEAFIELSEPGYSLVHSVLECDFLFVLRSLTKAFAIPGLRVGFAVASEALASVMNTARLTWNLNIVAERVGRWLLASGEEFLERSRAFIREERKWLTAQLTGIRGFKPLESRANFILVDISEFPLTPAELSERLLSRGILIRDCSSFGLEEHIRVAVLTREANQRLMDAIGAAVMEWGREVGEEKLKAALHEGHVVHSRVNCEYYPCHFEGQDCTFCFCPFYPCGDERTGGEYITRASGDQVWSCMKCHLIHRPEVAQRVLDELLKDSDVKKAWKRAVEPFL